MIRLSLCGLVRTASWGCSEVRASAARPFAETIARHSCKRADRGRDILLRLRS